MACRDVGKRLYRMLRIHISHQTSSNKAERANLATGEKPIFRSFGKVISLALFVVVVDSLQHVRVITFVNVVLGVVGIGFVFGVSLLT